MTDTHFKGEVISYPYRWAEEKALGRSIDGGKDRPCAVVLMVVDSAGQDLLVLAAVSSKPPRRGQAAVQVPEIERRRAGLDPYADAWIYVDEANVDRAHGSFFVTAYPSLGRLSRKFIGRVSEAMQRHLRPGHLVHRF